VCLHSRNRYRLRPRPRFGIAVRAHRHCSRNLRTTYASVAAGRRCTVSSDGVNAMQAAVAVPWITARAATDNVIS
jgi:hypothetical protein